MDSWTCDMDIDRELCTVFFTYHDCCRQRPSQCIANFHSEFISGVDISWMDCRIGVVLHRAG